MVKNIYIYISACASVDWWVYLCKLGRSDAATVTRLHRCAKVIERADRSHARTRMHAVIW